MFWKDFLLKLLSLKSSHGGKPPLAPLTDRNKPAVWAATPREAGWIYVCHMDQHGALAGNRSRSANKKQFDLRRSLRISAAQHLKMAGKNQSSWCKAMGNRINRETSRLTAPVQQIHLPLLLEVLFCILEPWRPHGSNNDATDLQYIARTLRTWITVDQYVPSVSVSRADS